MRRYLAGHALHMTGLVQHDSILKAAGAMLTRRPELTDAKAIAMIAENTEKLDQVANALVVAVDTTGETSAVGALAINSIFTRDTHPDAQ